MYIVNNLSLFCSVFFLFYVPVGRSEFFSYFHFLRGTKHSTRLSTQRYKTTPSTTPQRTSSINSRLIFGKNWILRLTIPFMYDGIKESMKLSSFYISFLSNFLTTTYLVTVVSIDNTFTINNEASCFTCTLPINSSCGNDVSFPRVCDCATDRVQSSSYCVGASNC